ncbi:MAG: HisA/HisF-related TIM barrel protein [Gammaproteobacteria bacterium]|nr:HisA/HisF-related TIM barrel protein [Gammaproteobacteria bacterium]
MTRIRMVIIVILVPVIDISCGQVVHARGGTRESYPLLQSILSRSSDPLAVVSGLLRLYPFNCLYIADLDAISGRQDQFTVIRRLTRQFPELHFWIDPGIDNLASLQRWQQHGPGIPVIGSETLTDPAILDILPGSGSVILSLDFRDAHLLGATDAIVSPEYWPRRVIVMSLDHVGRNRGPDLPRLLQLRATSAGVELYAAGGIRGPADLHALQQLHIDGALLASALHDGRIGTEDLNYRD